MVSYIFHIEHNDGHYSLARIDAETVSEALDAVVEEFNKNLITEVRYTTLVSMAKVEMWG